MTTLKEARADNRLNEFIAERETEASSRHGDADTLNRVVEAMAKTPRVVPRSSRRRRGDD